MASTQVKCCEKVESHERVSERAPLNHTRCSDEQISNKVTLSVGIVCNSLDGGGAERACYLLANALARLPTLRVTMLLFHTGGVFEEQVAPNVRILSQRFQPKRVSWMGKLGFLWYWQRRLNLTVILSFGEWPSAICGLLTYISGSPLKVIGFEQNTRNFLTTPEEYGLKPWFSTVVAASYRGLSEVVCSSVAVRRALVPHVKEAKLSVIHNPINLTEILEKSAEAPCIQLDPANRQFVAVGRLHRQKDYPTMLNAFNIAFQSDKMIELHILGTGSEEGDLRALVEGMECRNAVHFHGFQDNPFSIMRRCDALIHSAIFEGFGNVFAEALAVGTPVITTDCDTPREIITDDVLGRIVPVGDSEALAELILRQARKSTTVSAECRRRAQDFDVARYTDSVMRVLRSQVPPQVVL